MTKAENPREQAICWNGMAISVPKDWQPVVILEDYLLFEADYCPVLEMKWQQVQGSLSPERIIRKLRKGGSRKDIIEPWRVDDAWKQALQRFDTIGFMWQGANNTGKGLLLHCPTCGRATLVRLYGRHPENNPTCLRILASLHDHPEKQDAQHWAIYDISFTLPSAAILQSQEFLTGSYVISFQLHDFFIHLLRMKPAEILLNGSTLQNFGTRLIEHGEQPVPGNNGDRQACWLKQASNWQRLRAKLRRQQADHCLLLRHVPEKNAILGIRAAGNRPIELQAVQTLFSDYSVQ